VGWGQMARGDPPQSAGVGHRARWAGIYLGGAAGRSKRSPAAPPLWPPLAGQEGIADGGDRRRHNGVTAGIPRRAPSRPGENRPPGVAASGRRASPGGGQWWDLPPRGPGTAPAPPARGGGLSAREGRWILPRRGVGPGAEGIPRQGGERSNGDRPRPCRWLVNSAAACPGIPPRAIQRLREGGGSSAGGPVPPCSRDRGGQWAGGAGADQLGFVFLPQAGAGEDSDKMARHSVLAAACKPRLF